MTTVANDRVPVTVLTGFLGAGKTTLLNRILSEPHGRKYAVIVNEFGEIGIDNDLIVGSDEEIYEMNNGCICCTVRGDLVRIFEALLKRRNKFDGIVVETTGLADPAPVIQTFFLDPEVGEQTRLDAVVTVVDARHIRDRLADTVEAQVQIVFADVLVLNKLDLVTPAEQGVVQQVLRRLNPTAKIVTSTRCDLPIAEVLDLGAFDLARIQSLDPALVPTAPQDQGHDHHDHHDHGHDHHGHHGHHDHHDACGADCVDPSHPHLHTVLDSLSLSATRPLDEARFQSWIETLVREQGVDLLRSKGILAFAGQNDRFVFQGVHMVLDGSYQQAWRPHEPRISRLVFIGRNLDKARLTAEFAALAA